MPLTEHEQRVLEDLERRLAADDPKLAAKLAPKPPSLYQRWRTKRLMRKQVGRVSWLEARWNRRMEYYGR